MPESDRAGEPEGDKTGEPEGDKVGEPESDKAGEPEGDKVGEPESDRAGEPESGKVEKTAADKTGEPESDRVVEPEGDVAGEAEARKLVETVLESAVEEPGKSEEPGRSAAGESAEPKGPGQAAAAEEPGKSEEPGRSAAGESAEPKGPGQAAAAEGPGKSEEPGQAAAAEELPGRPSGGNFQMYTLKPLAASDRLAKTPSGKEKERKTPKKKTGFFQKALLAVSLGLLFGLFAGMGIYAVMEATGSLPGRGVDEEAVLDLIDEALAEQKHAPVDWEHAEVTRVITSDVSEMVAEVIPAMVCIVNNYLDEGTTFFGQSYSEILPASGSGIIVEENDTELLIATNYHVVEGTVELDVTFIDGSEAEAQVKGTDPEMDLAVIAVPLSELEPKTRRAIGYAKLGDSDSLVMGQPVIALGNALGYGQSMTGGYVSAPEREVTMEDGSTGIFIQTDAAINPGNSGGALLNLQGEVIGINSSKIGGTLVDGVGFAIPISAAEPIIGELKLKETRFKVAEEDRGYIGIVMAELDYQFQEIYGVPEGAFVKEVNEGSPAQEAGILPGDVVVALGEDSVSSIDELQGVLEYYSAGTTTSLTVMRLQEGVYQEVELTITLGKKPASMR